MAASEFFNRWARRKPDSTLPGPVGANSEPGAVPETSVTTSTESVVSTPGQPTGAAEPPRLPTLEDAELLTPDGNFVPFMADGVDDAVRSAALKKLFADPQFNIMDGLDIYVGDYSNMETMPESMLHQLNHARDLLDPLGTLERAAQSVERERQADLALELSGAGQGASNAAPLVDDASLPVTAMPVTAMPDRVSLPDAAPFPNESLPADTAPLSDAAMLPVEAHLAAAQAALSQPDNAVGINGGVSAEATALSSTATFAVGTTSTPNPRE
jgi:hypothetical protein